MPSSLQGPLGVGLVVLVVVGALVAWVRLAPAGPTRRRRSIRLARLAVVAAALVAAVVVVRTWVLTGYRMPNAAMADTFDRGDRLIAARVLSRFGDPSRGDVVVFHPNGRRGRAYFAPTAADLTDVKRVVGLPGEWIRARAGKVQICRDAAGRRCRVLSEPYVSSRQTDFGPIHVPKDRYFLLGDNRLASVDSRTWGAIRPSQIVARAFMVAWPLTRIRFF